MTPPSIEPQRMQPRVVTHQGSSASLNLTPPLVRPSAQPTRTTQSLSFKRKQPVIKPTVAAQLVLARPHQTLDHGVQAASQMLSRRVQTLIVHPKVRSHPSAVLALFVVTGAAVGTANVVVDAGASARDWLVEDHLRAPARFVAKHAGDAASVPLALLCDGVGVTLGINVVVVALVAASVAGMLTGMGILPTLCFLPNNVKKSVADGLCSYITLSQRFNAVEAMLSFGEQHNDPAAPSISAQPEPGRLRAALDGLQAQIEALSFHEANHAPPEPAHVHFQFISQMLASYPNAGARLGLTAPPSTSRLMTVDSLLVEHMQTKPRRANRLNRAQVQP